MRAVQIGADFLHHCIGALLDPQHFLQPSVGRHEIDKGRVINGIVLAVAGGYGLTQRALRPLRALAATARHVIDSGDLSQRVPVRGSGDELDEVASLVNEMLAHNQRLVTGMREALDNVAHDLRTPLTRVRGTAELALRTNDAPAAREALADCIEETDRVLVMLRTLMDISEAETGIMRLDRTRVSLDQLVREIAELYAHVADDAGVVVRVDAESAWRGRQVPPPVQARQPYRDYDSDEYPVYGGQPGHHGKRKRRGSFLEELFD